jgi:hypothetical protein
MSVDSGQHKAMVAVLKAQFPTIVITSTFRNNSVVNGSGSTSYHATGRAVDMSPRADVFEWIKKNYPNSSELIFSPMGNRQVWNGKEHLYSGVTRADHWDHVHWAMASFGGATPAVDADKPLLQQGLEAINPLQPLIDLFNFLTDPATWLRIATGLLGVGLLLGALVAFTGQNAVTLMKGAAKSAAKPLKGAANA